jgi:hypothetical protein
MVAADGDPNVSWDEGHHVGSDASWNVENLVLDRGFLAMGHDFQMRVFMAFG